MDNRIALLYQQIKEGTIGQATALAQIQQWRAEQNQAGNAFLPLNKPAASLSHQGAKVTAAMGGDTGREKAESFFKSLLATVLKLPADRIEAEAPLEKYGIDSVMVIQLTNELEKIFGSLPKTLFFEYQDLRSLIRYFLETYPDVMRQQLGLEEKQASDDAAAASGHHKAEPSLINRGGLRRSLKMESSPPKGTDALDIAIIGLAGRYPGARNLWEFWENLREGRDCITEIPAERWDHSLYFDADRNRLGKTYTKWGGFIDGVDQFDPKFFNIAPREAEMMDPQERLFLQCVHETFEDAGITRQALAKLKGRGLEGNVGVFVGVMYEEYQLYGAQAQTLGMPVALSGNPASIANRVSYIYNLHGPSMAVDSMCSSSLTAIHLACHSLQRGECELAVAGGVNVSVHPNKYLGLAQGKFASSKGRCESFGSDGDGYVPGEGVGAVLLKSLFQAIADGDQIYGVIKGSALNHGGKTNGYTVPNPNAQAEVVGRAYREAGIQPRMVSYIEAHGTGTSLGDPIEIAGLCKVFGVSTAERRYCAIGSVKSNIGHCESAAGIAGLTKVLLQLKYRQLVPSLHSRTLNPNIDFDHTPFVVQQEAEEWQCPGAADGRLTEQPRISGISAFGAGGSNAHLIIEEYLPAVPECRFGTISPSNPAVILLSAKNEAGIKDYVLQWLDFLEKSRFCDADLADIAYTLQIGREAMEERLAVLAASLTELQAKLRGYLAQEADLSGVYRGKVKRTGEALAVFAEDEDFAETIEKWIERRKSSKLAELWTKGGTFDWHRLYGEEAKPRRLSIPTYPFARERYWAPVMLSGFQAATRIGSTLEQPQGLSVAPVDIEADYEILTFQETWTGEADQGTAPVAINTLVCFAADPEQRQVLSDTLRHQGLDNPIVYLSPGEGYCKQSPELYFVSNDDKAGYIEAFQSIAKHFGEIGAILYLWPLEVRAGLPEYAPIVNLIQALAQAKLKPSRLMLAGRFENGLESCYLESWIGFERSLRLILPDTPVAVCLQEVLAAEKETAAPVWLGNCVRELQTSRFESVRYFHQGQRQVCRIQATTLQPGTTLIKAGGTYLITGGCGGLGLQFAAHFAQTPSVNLILTGRSPLDREKQSTLQTLEAHGSQVVYLEADVSDRAAMQEKLALARERFGKINGVIHAAGVQSHQSILEKDPQSFQQTVEAKIKGTLLLDELTAEDPLDFICYFSSSSAILGDFGSCDYAVANRFQMAYALHRNQTHSGKVIAVNWPLWREGGMGGADAESTRMYLKTSGQRLLETREGTALFDLLLAQEGTQPLVLAGQRSRVNRFLGLESGPAENGVSPVPGPSRSGKSTAMEGWSLEQRLESDLKAGIGQILKIAPDQLDADENLADMGFDSISLAELATRLTQDYQIEITPVVFFGYPTIEKVIHFLMQEHQAAIEQYYQAVVPTKSNPTVIPGALFTERTQNSAAPCLETGANPLSEPIAIIGMSGRFPQANNVEEFWENLQTGRNCISKIPTNRWKENEYQEVEQLKTARGGFIDQAAEFDPLFFEIAPKEAAAMDPRQRIFLEEAWHALEDAGYMGERIKGRSCGVYVGVEEGEYGVLAGPTGGINSNQNATLSARIAYTLDLKGPNLAVTAACSSGLVAVHQAMQALRQEECEIALAGGINLFVTPMVFAAVGSAAMLSAEGQCHVFDNRASGLVPGEAVAVVVLKPLAKAIADRDRIYGCIKASGVNHNGRTNGITASSPQGQAELIAKIYQRYQINPEAIQYVMAHSVGSKLGDPIEIQALASVFGKYTSKKQYCALGSVKPQIGHTFAASGIVSLISVLLAMRHRKLLPIHNFEVANEYIHFNESPFVIYQSLKPWETQTNQPRLAAISTTGISGTNAHAVIEEYLPRQSKAERGDLATAPQLIVMSARNSERLSAVVQQMMQFLQNNPGVLLQDVAYTLQTGREAMRSRVAFIADTIEELLPKLAAYCLEPIEKLRPAKIFAGTVRKLPQTKLTKRLETAINERDLELLATLWIEGVTIPWENLYLKNQAQRIALPTYPFEKKRCWIPEVQVACAENSRIFETKKYANKAEEYYAYCAKDRPKEYIEEYLTFCPFIERLDGFSLSGAILNPDQFQMELEYVKSKQLEMRQVLFHKIDFAQVHNLFDIGCGYGTDMIRFALQYPHIHAQGFTITKVQAELANERILEKGLQSRVEVFHKDSTEEPFPGRYDLIIGIEVCCHIYRKQEVFKRMDAALNSNGKVLLMDFISNLRVSIENPNVEISIATNQEWIDIFSTNHLAVEEIIDVSPQISNFLHDPDYEKNLRNLPQVVQEQLQNFANSSTSLQQGWISYCLFRLTKEVTLSEPELRHLNEQKIANQMPYPQALVQMKGGDDSAIAGGQNGAEKRTRFYQETTSNWKSGNFSEGSGTEEIRAKLEDIFGEIFGIDREELDESATLLELGISSINAVKLLQAINVKFNTRISMNVIFECNDLHSLINQIESQILQTFERKTTPNNEAKLDPNPIPATPIATQGSGTEGRTREKWGAWPEFPELVHLNGSRQGRPVFWFHGGFGGVEAYYPIAQEFDRPFFGIQARGWNTNRAPLNGIQAMAIYNVLLIQSVQPEGPYDLGGYSFGGTMAYEVARLLQEQGQKVNTIVMLDSLYEPDMGLTVYSEKNLILQTVNVELLDRQSVEMKQLVQRLISRDELDPNLEDEAFLHQIVALAKTRGFSQSKAQLHNEIQKRSSIQKRILESYNCSFLPLPDPRGVTCYYFRNQSGRFFGELQPFFLIEDYDDRFQDRKYWEVYQKALPDFHLTDVNSSNHMMLLMEPEPYSVISEFCKKLYSNG